MHLIKTANLLFSALSVGLTHNAFTNFVIAITPDHTMKMNLSDLGFLKVTRQVQDMIKYGKNAVLESQLHSDTTGWNFYQSKSLIWTVLNNFENLRLKRQLHLYVPDRNFCQPERLTGTFLK